VEFDVIDQLLIRNSAFARYWRINGSTMGLNKQLLIDFKKAYDSDRREVLGIYIILIEFGISVKLVRPIKMCLN
jgi:hypothetical protein